MYKEGKQGIRAYPLILLVSSSSRLVSLLPPYTYIYIYFSHITGERNLTSIHKIPRMCEVNNREQQLCFGNFKKARTVKVEVFILISPLVLTHESLCHQFNC